MNSSPTFICASAKTSLHPHSTLMVNHCVVAHLHDNIIMRPTRNLEVFNDG